MPRKGGVPQNLTHTWQKGQSGNPKGRQPNKMLPILKKALNKVNAAKLNMTLQEVESWEMALLTLPTSAIKAIVGNPETPTYVVNLGMAIISDIKNGRTSTIDKLRDRQFGKIADKVEITGADGADLFQNVTISTEQIDRLQVLCNRLTMTKEGNDTDTYDTFAERGGCNLRKRGV